MLALAGTPDGAAISRLQHAAAAVAKLVRASPPSKSVQPA
jgi:hypothetical protein